MPIITIETWPMPPERKPELMKKITQVFTEWGVPPQASHHPDSRDTPGKLGHRRAATFGDLQRDETITFRFFG
jgi:hypothetical protein